MGLILFSPFFDKYDGQARKGKATRFSHLKLDTERPLRASLVFFRRRRGGRTHSIYIAAPVERSSAPWMESRVQAGQHRAILF